MGAEPSTAQKELGKGGPVLEPGCPARRQDTTLVRSKEGLLVAMATVREDRGGPW